MYILFVFIIGLFFGSFFCVVVDRINRNEGFLWNRSKCESCGKTLTWYDLIPVLSYLSTKGKCRYCKAVIPIKLLITEITTGIIFAGLTTYNLYNTVLNLPNLILSLLIASSLLIIFISDLEYGIIPDEVLIFLSVISVIFVLNINNKDIISHFITGLISFMCFLLLFLFTKERGVGFGDVKFAFVIGLLLGFPNTIIAFYSAFLTGAFISIILIVIGKKRLKNDTVPFGPFLVLGILIAVLFAEKVLTLINI